MYVPRLLVLPLLIAICGAPVTAQSAPPKEDPFQLLPTPPQDVRVGIHGHTIRLSPDGMNLSYRIPPPVMRGPSNCYSIGTYRVNRQDPESDLTTPAGYSLCEPAALFHLKVVGDSPGEVAAAGLER